MPRSQIWVGFFLPLYFAACQTPVTPPQEPIVIEGKGEIKGQQKIEHGHLSLTTQPKDATILVNGEIVASETPAIISLPAGVHHLVCVRSGFSRVRVEAAVPAGELVTKTIDLAAHQPVVKEFQLYDDVKIAMVWIEPGSFVMGSPDDEDQREANETQHKVRLSRGFWMAQTEVTQRQWQAVMGSSIEDLQAGADPAWASYGIGDDYPVFYVSWQDAQTFLNKVNQALGEKVFRLPTEAEWEYACRAGTTTPFNLGTKLDAGMANFWSRYPYGGGKPGGYRKQAVPVKSYEPNAWSLYDMHGNVWEWCADWFGDYPQGAAVDPVGVAKGKKRVIRGGGWSIYGRRCRAAHRFGFDPEKRRSSLGFRLVRTTD